MMFQKALHRIRPHNGLDNRFLYYSFLHEGRTGGFEALFTGATIKHLPLQNLAKVEIEIPPLNIQHRIASILSAYDDLIENNTRRIQILEEMAQRIYTEWFVHFRFPGHEKVKMVDSELGKIPSGWEVSKLGYLLNFIKNPTKSGDHLKSRYYVPIDCIGRKQLHLTESKTWEEAKSSLILFDEDDILFGANAALFPQSDNSTV